MMKIGSFNVNGIRARLPIVTGWLEKTQIDVLCVQETKVQDIEFPAETFEEIGYKYVFRGQKSYNGVAIFSKAAIEEVEYGFDDEPKDESRLIKAKIGGVNIVNSYVPQGRSKESDKFSYKLEWFDRLKKYFEDHFSPNDMVLWLGDLNVAPEAIDVHDPAGLAGHVCFCEEVSSQLEKVKNWGLSDLLRMHNKEAGVYTFWDYRNKGGLSRNRGWRIDHLMGTKALAEKCVGCYIDIGPRKAERPSDHTPIIGKFDL
ncbi:MAG: exodeoxyribonuclease III [SAR324 cluster bacterium]|nr:exodeoxyribonuclease III [SAR324 cluster bacterium]